MTQTVTNISAYVSILSSLIMGRGGRVGGGGVVGGGGGGGSTRLVCHPLLESVQESFIIWLRPSPPPSTSSLPFRSSLPPPPPLSK